MKIRPVGAELFHAGGRANGRTYITKVVVSFRNFGKTPDKKKRRRVAASNGCETCDPSV